MNPVSDPTVEATVRAPEGEGEKRRRHRGGRGRSGAGRPEGAGNAMVQTPVQDGVTNAAGPSSEQRTNEQSERQPREGNRDGHGGS